MVGWRVRMQEWHSERGGKNNVQVRVAESGNSKLDHQFFFSIHFDLWDCTISICCDLRHLRRKERTVKMWRGKKNRWWAKAVTTRKHQVSLRSILSHTAAHGVLWQEATQALNTQDKNIIYVLARTRLPAEHLSMAQGHLQALGGVGWWGKEERALSSGADCCSTQWVLYWNRKHRDAQFRV